VTTPFTPYVITPFIPYVTTPHVITPLSPNMTTPLTPNVIHFEIKRCFCTVNFVIYETLRVL